MIPAGETKNEIQPSVFLFRASTADNLSRNWRENGTRRVFPNLLWRTFSTHSSRSTSAPIQADEFAYE